MKRTQLTTARIRRVSMGIVVIALGTFLALGFSDSLAQVAESEGLTASRPHHVRRPLGLSVKPRTLPLVAGIDRVRVTMLETYEVEGVGKEEVVLTGMFVMRRGAPLQGLGEKCVSWETSTVVAQFEELSLVGKSKLFGEVHVTLDRTERYFAVVRAGKCVANVRVNVDMPDLGLSLSMKDAMHLESEVETVPPVGDERTVSVNSVALVDDTGRVRGTLLKARVSWRELLSQRPFVKQ